jgi:hypothetical protein
MHGPWPVVSCIWIPRNAGLLERGAASAVDALKQVMKQVVRPTQRTPENLPDRRAGS